MRWWITRSGALAFTLTLGLGGAFGQPPVPVPSPPPAAAKAEPGKSAVAATVNGEPILLERVDAFLKHKLQVGPITVAQNRQLRAQVVNDMVDDLLLRQFLREKGPKVEAAEIDRHLKAFTENLTRQGKTLAEFLSETHQTEATLRENWTAHLQLNGYMKQQTTIEQLKKYYEANKDVFDQTEVKVSHIVIRVGPKTPAPERASARGKLKAVREAIVSRKVEFVDAAKMYSQCPSSPEGGNLGYIPRKGGLLDEAFAKAAFALKVGELSEIVETEYGLHLIKVTDRKPGLASTFEKSIEDVRDAVAEDMRADLIAKLRKVARIQITIP